MIRWANSIGLEDYADFLRESGVHGALIALDETFDVEQFAYFLQIPSTNEKVFQELFTTVLQYTFLLFLVVIARLSQCVWREVEFKNQDQESRIKLLTTHFPLK